MQERKFFLDWLRVIAFGLLILFHVGLLYVTWPYNLKSDRIFPNLELLMNSLSAWRLVLLFFISGVASRFLLAKLGPGGFSVDRIKRLVPVILLGTFILNPIQVYVEFLNKAYIEPGYLDFWLGAYLQAQAYPGRIIPSWDHLWFIVYLLFYVLGLALLSRLLTPATTAPKRTFHPITLLMVPALLLCLTNTLVTEVSPVTQALVDDWANHLRWICVFGVGVVCAFQTELWTWLQRHRRRLFFITFTLFLLQLANGIYYRIGQADPFWDGITYSFSMGMYGWFFVLTLSGYAAQYLNRSSPLLSYLTEAVLPIYVVHQPILLVAAYLLFPLSLPVPLEALLLILITGLGSFALYEYLARRWAPMRFLFGLKKPQQSRVN